MSPVERRNDRLRNVEIPNRLLHDPDGTDDTEDDLDTAEAGGDGDGDDGADDDATTDQGYENDDPANAPAAGGGGRGGRGRFSLKVLLRLYRGQTKFDFVGRRRWWFLLSGLIIVSGLVSFSIRGFDFGIDFKGGSSWEVTATGVSQATVVKAVEAAGLGPTATVEILGGKTIEVQADLNSLPTAKQNTISNNVSNALERFAPGQSVSKSTVGPTWGGQVTDHALIALVAFFIIVGIYISLRFEPKMALAAFAALVHDLLVAAGVYSLVGFQVTPDTVVAILTILGYSLYDTVVVFDRVRDNARGLGATGRMTYSEMVNLSMNQTLARSINTSLVAILPVLAVLLIGAELLGAVTLQNYGLALFVGLLSGAYSSIFIASPILAIMKEREPRYTVIRQRLSARADRTGVLTPAAAALLVGAAGAGSRQGAGARAGRPGPLRPGALRPGAARAGRAPAGSGNGAREPGVAAASVGGTGPSAAQARSTPARRPPPRPRKGAKRGGKKRR